jgi:SAM-dependent methyltransferase
MSISQELQAQFGRIDIYLFDLLHKGRLDHVQRVLDAGCGGGRNTVFLLKQGVEVFGIDREEEAIGRIREMARAIDPDCPADERFVVSPLDTIPFKEPFDFIMCSAVLHFSESEAQFAADLQSMWNALAPGGIFFSRLASTEGFSQWYAESGQTGRVMQMPDGHTRFLVDHEYLKEWTERLGGTLLERLKTSVVDDLRAMATWVVQKQ